EQPRRAPPGPRPARPRREAALLVAATTEQLDQQGAGHVEALGHRRVHRGVEVHLVAGDRPQAAAPALGGEGGQGRRRRRGWGGRSTRAAGKGEKGGRRHSSSAMATSVVTSVMTWETTDPIVP